MKIQTLSATNPGQIPRIPVGTNSPFHYKNWQQIHRVTLRVQFEVYDSNFPGELSFEQFCQRVFMYARWHTEPTLN